MKTWLLAALLTLPIGGDRERGLDLYRQGKYREAAAAFRAALQSEGDTAELQYNLALASWRAGDLPAAESAVEKYAATAADARPDLHAGLLGAVRHDEAVALALAADQAAAGGAPAPAPGAQAEPVDPLPMLEQALAKAMQAKEHFVRGATQAASQELLRNTERAVRLCDELQKKIDDLKKQREQQKQDDDKQQDDKQDDKKDGKKDDKQDEKQEPGEPKPDDKKPPGDRPEDGDKKPDESKPDQQQQGDPKGDPAEKPEPQPAAKGPDGQQGAEPPAEPPAAEPRHDAPGEANEARELTPEQTQRLLELLKNLDGKAKELRTFGTTRRRSVERDW